MLAVLGQRLTAACTAGWEWEGAWQVDRLSAGVDNEGWSYGSDFSMLSYPPAPVMSLTDPTKQLWLRPASALRHGHACGC